jgi:nuclear transcription factor Y gamma
MSNPNYNAAIPGASANVQPPPKRYDGRDGGPVYDPSHGGHYGASSYVCVKRYGLSHLGRVKLTVTDR